MVVASTAAADANANNTNKKLTFKNCVPCKNCVTEINNKQRIMPKICPRSCQCTTCYNIVITMQKHKEFYSNITETILER